PRARVPGAANVDGPPGRQYTLDRARAEWRGGGQVAEEAVGDDRPRRREIAADADVAQDAEPRCREPRDRPALDGDAAAQAVLRLDISQNVAQHHDVAAQLPVGQEAAEA